MNANRIRSARRLVQVGALLALAAPSLAQEWATSTEGAVARSFPDRNATAVAELPSGTFLKIIETSEGTRPFHRVEVAGSFQVWVHGRYLAETGVDGVFTVTGDRLNMRPAPSGGADSFPLPDRLDRGAQVEFCARFDESLPLSEDWVKIWAPRGSTAWVEASKTAAAADAVKASAAFARGYRSLPSESKPATAAEKPSTEAKAPASVQETRETASAGSRSAMRKADDLFDAATASNSTDAATWSAVAAAYDEVVAQAGEGKPLGVVAARQAERARLQVELAQLKGNLSEREQQRQERIQKMLDTARQHQLAKTATWGRFDGRGYLESTTDVDGNRRWYLVWSGARRFEVVNGDGRYDLEVFEGYQIGVQGAVRRAYSAPTLETDELLTLLDIRRIEVIRGSRGVRN